MASASRPGRLFICVSKRRSTPRTRRHCSPNDVQQQHRRRRRRRRRRGRRTNPDADAAAPPIHGPSQRLCVDPRWASRRLSKTFTTRSHSIALSLSLCLTHSALHAAAMRTRRRSRRGPRGVATSSSVTSGGVDVFIAASTTDDWPTPRDQPPPPPPLALLAVPNLKLDGVATLATDAPPMRHASFYFHFQLASVSDRHRP